MNCVPPHPGGTLTENDTYMMYPELMEILVRSRHDYLRSLAQGDSALDDARNLLSFLRHALGGLMVRTGRMLGGQPAPTLTLQDT